VDRNGNTCLHYAAKYRHEQCIRLLIGKFRHYKINNIEKENIFGLKPNDFLTIDEAKIIEHEAKGRRSARLADRVSIESCRNSILSYCELISNCSEPEKTLENFFEMSQKTEQSQKVQLRPKTAPVKLKFDHEQNDTKEKQEKNEIVTVKTELPVKKTRSSSLQSYKEVLSSKNSEFSVKNRVTTIMKNYIQRSGDSEIVENILLINRYELLLNTIVEKNAYDDRIERVESTLQQQKTEKSQVIRPETALKAKSHIDNRPGTAFYERKINTENVPVVREPEIAKKINAENSNGQTSWRWQMKHLLSHMEIRESPSYRRTITPVVNSRIESAKEEPVGELEETRMYNQRKLSRRLSKQISMASVSNVLIFAKKAKP